jgi:hypothetical protein
MAFVKATDSGGGTFKESQLLGRICSYRCYSLIGLGHAIEPPTSLC